MNFCHRLLFVDWALSQVSDDSDLSCIWHLVYIWFWKDKSSFHCSKVRLHFHSASLTIPQVVVLVYPILSTIAFQSSYMYMYIEEFQIYWLLPSFPGLWILAPRQSVLAIGQNDDALHPGTYTRAPGPNWAPVMSHAISSHRRPRFNISTSTSWLDPTCTCIMCRDYTYMLVHTCVYCRIVYLHSHVWTCLFGDSTYQGGRHRIRKQWPFCNHPKSFTCMHVAEVNQETQLVT